MQAQPQSNSAARIPSQTTSPLRSSVLHATRQPTVSVAETTGLAHDAGNLLAALGLYSELLSVPGVLRPEQQHYAVELSLIADRSTRLISRLLAAPFAAVQEPLPLTDATPLVPTRLFCRRKVSTSDPLANEGNHAAMLLSLAPVLDRIAAGAAAVTVTCPLSLPPLSFPSEIIERITVNLVRNAAEAIRLQQPRTAAAPGQIRVTLAILAHRLQLTVEDNGPGMSPAGVEAYLNPSPLPLGANHGFGHRIVHELAAVSQGKLSIHARLGHGTTFSLKWQIPDLQFAESSPANVPLKPSTA
jgi:signal transduction histidine kinase